MTTTYVSEAVAEIKKALIESNLSKVNDYANNKSYQTYVRLVINEHFMIDKFAQINNDFIRQQLIKTNNASSYYKKWAKTGSFLVKSKLIEHGHCLDTLINDEDSAIRLNVVDKDPNYWPLIMNKSDIEFYYASEWLKSQEQINLKLLDSILKIFIKKKNPQLYQALTLKHQAMTHTPTTIEKTMATRQLCAMGSPLWAKDMTIQEIIDINKYITKAKENHLDAHIPELVMLLFKNLQIYWHIIIDDFIEKHNHEKKIT